MSVIRTIDGRNGKEGPSSRNAQAGVVMMELRPEVKLVMADPSFSDAGGPNMTVCDTKCIA